MPTSRTENSVTALVAEKMREYGLNVQTWESFSGGSIEEGLRDEPDLVLEFNGKKFYGEAKWDGDYWEGFGEAHEYEVNIKDADGAFVISYPKDLKAETIQTRLDQKGETRESLLENYRFKSGFMFKDEDKETNHSEKVGFGELLNWIQSNLEENEEVDSNSEEMIKILEDTVEELTSEIEASKRQNLFKNVIGGELDEEDEDILKATESAAGYLLVNQIVFYRVLSEKNSNYPDIETENLEHPSDLHKKYFKKVLEKDYTPVFGAEVALDFSEESIDDLKSAINTIYGLAPERINKDVLGKVFHRLIPYELRKKVAAYYTLNSTAEFLTELSIEDGEESVIDPACGSGTLLVESYKRLEENRQKNGLFNEEDHRELIEQKITGIDVMPFAGHLSVIHLSLQNLDYETEKVRIGVTDSTALKPGDTTKAVERILPEAEKGQRDLHESIDKENNEDRAIDIDLDLIAKREIEIEKKDQVVMNPPFTRFQKISNFGEDYSKRLNKRLSEYHNLINGRMGYFAFFMLLSDRLLKDTGKVSAVLPNSFLIGKSMKDLRRYISEEYDLKYIIVRDDKANFSEDTSRREILFIAKKGRSEDNLTSFVHVRSLDKNVARKVERARKRCSHRESIEEESFSLENLKQDELNHTNLYQYVALTDKGLLNLTEEIEGKSSMTTFGEKDVEIRTHDDSSTNGGSFRRFGLNKKTAEKLNQDKWVIEEEMEESVKVRNRYSDKNFEIPFNSVKPALRRLSGTETIDVSNLQEYVLVAPFSEIDEFKQLSEAEDIDWGGWRGYLDKRESHLSVGTRLNIGAPNTKVLAFQSEKERVWARAGNCAVLGIDSEESKFLALWYNSIFNILQILKKRKETEGSYLQINKFLLKNFAIPDSKKFGEDKIGEVNDNLEEYSHEKMPSIVEQLAYNSSKKKLSENQVKKITSAFENLGDQIGKGYQPRKGIDKEFKELLGVEVDLEELYSKTLYEIAVLKQMMEAE